MNILGKSYGSKTHTLTVAQMPAHGHPMKFSLLAVSGGARPTPTSSGTETGDGIVTNTGGGQAHNIVQPTTTVNILVKY